MRGPQGQPGKRLVGGGLRPVRAHDDHAVAGGDLLDDTCASTRHRRLVRDKKNMYTPLDRRARHTCLERLGSAAMMTVWLWWCGLGFVHASAAVAAAAAAAAVLSALCLVCPS